MRTENRLGAPKFRMALAKWLPPLAAQPLRFTPLTRR